MRARDHSACTAERAALGLTESVLLCVLTGSGLRVSPQDPAPRLCPPTSLGTLPPPSHHAV